MNAYPPPRADRLGLVLFAFYSVLYFGFVLVSAFAADRMDADAVAGLNFAIVAGFGLIVIAVLLSLAYGLLRRPERDA